MNRQAYIPHAQREVEHCCDMTDVRRNIDALDAELVELLALRGAYVAQAARIKNDEKLVVDEERIEYIIRRVRQLAEQSKLPADIAERTWRPMIAAYIDFEMQQVKERQRVQNKSAQDKSVQDG